MDWKLFGSHLLKAAIIGVAPVIADFVSGKFNK
jgi:hypothetical protein